MVRRLLPIIVLLCASAAYGQLNYGNEWIDHDRQYWRFDVYSTGLHRIDSTALANAGFPVGSVAPGDLMLFGREKQVPIYIQGGEDGVLNGTDFIEFVGRMNDGWIDTRMYANAQQHANPHYSMFNDTIHYFLTWNPDPAVAKKRVVPYENMNISDHTPRPWVWGLGNSLLSDYYWLGMVEQPYIATSGMMVAGEGWGGGPLHTVGPTRELPVNTNTPRAYAGADAPLAEVNVAVSSQNADGRGSSLDHHLELLTGPGNSVPILDTIYMGSQVLRKSFQVPAAYAVGNFNMMFRVQHDLNGPGQVGAINPSYLDFQTPSAITIRYPRDLNSSGAGPVDLWIPNETGQPIARLDMAAFNGTPVLYADGDTVRRIQPTLAGNIWQALVPANADSATTHNFLFANEGTRTISTLSPVNGDGYFIDYGAMDPDSAILMVAHRRLWNGATTYANYRSSSAPDPRPTVLADIEDLYDQFGGGVPKNSLAIRSWSKFVLDTWTTVPQGLFLIGKSVNTSTNIYADGYRRNVNGAYARCLVPSYGYPACDQCFTIGLNFDPRKVEIPVGRLSASSEQQVFDYLNKVMELEGQPAAPWMKNIVHLSGGFNDGEQDNLAFVLRSLEPQLGDNTSFGGQFTRFRKSNSQTFATAAADSVRNLIENGVTLMNFFAHAYSEGFDITIDDPANYEWNGKYPLVLGNSCYIGNIHLNADLSTTSEDWVMRDGKGPIGFLSTIQQGIVPWLAIYNNYLYTSIGSANYGGTIGKHMQYAAFQYLSAQNNLIATYTVHTFTLEGDPMVVLNSPKEPDLMVTDEDIFFSPANVNADVDTFTVKVVLRNIGRIIPDSIGVQLERLNTGLTGPQIYNTVLSQMGFSDTAYFRVPTRAFAGGQGLNAFHVRVDLDPDLITEIQEVANNTASTTLFITSGDLVPIYPYDFAIVPESGPQLRASTGDPLASMRSYLFQIDTTDTFSSPVMQSATITAVGGVISWQPTTIYNIDSQQDSTVYFWRCAIDSLGSGQYNWYERSFQYIPGKRGWGQAHYFQFKNDDFNSIIYDRPERDFDFQTAPHELSAWSPGFDYFDDCGWRLDLTNVDYSGCAAEASWHVAVIDPYTFQPWKTRWTDNSVAPPITYNPDHNFGNQNDLSNCRNRTMGYFAFKQNIPAQMTALQAMLEGIPVGHHILLYTWLYVNQDGMSAAPGLMPYMENSFGVPFSTMQDSVPYIFYIQKGVPTTFRDTVGTDINSNIRLSTQIASTGDRGFITTMDAGPALQWHGLYWDEQPLSPTDSTVIQLKGVSAGGSVVDLVEFQSELDEVTDLSPFLNASTYPKLRIQGKFHDLEAAQPMPGQMKRWQLLYDPVPECAIDPQLGLYQALDGWFEGQNAAVAVAVHNISEFDMDSLLMTAWVVRSNNTRQRIHYRRNAPLPAGTSQVDTIRFNTLGFGGANTLLVEANPVDTTTQIYDQPEQYHFNNIAQWRFNVEVDIENPLLDVTFDGMHILDGDIVSARPEIEILLNDENTFRLLDSPADTAQFKVFLTRPGQPGEQLRFRDGAGNQLLQFIPANGPENEARIIYRPNFSTDGKYLLTVSAKDLSSNVSGDNDYSITFEVINRTTITEVLNYPNPFTTSTRFLFTLTGSEIPTYMKIQILTITGKVVREVKMHELGPLRVGRNMTDFAWDGTDEFGDRLARGVYLYRVIAQLNGEDIEYRQTSASSYFNKGFGKMYLLR